MNKLALALVATAAIAAAMPLAAQSADDDVPHATVSYRDLDLTTPNGQARFRTRLRTTVDRICRVGGRLDLMASQMRNQCVETARSSADAAFASAVASKQPNGKVQVAAR